MARRPNPFQQLSQRQTDVQRQQAQLRRRVSEFNAIRSLKQTQQRINRDIAAAPQQTRGPGGRFGYKRAGTYRESDEHEGNFVIDYTPSVGVPRRTVRAAYDADRQALRVVFARGAPDAVSWEYRDVSPEMAAQFAQQASPGRWINTSGINGHPHGRARYDGDDPNLGIPF